MVKQMSEQLNREFVGVDFNFSQYIQDNIEEAVSGREGRELGQDLRPRPRRAGAAVEGRARPRSPTVPGVTDPAAFNLLGQPNLVVRIDRAKAARYGFSVGDINSVVQAAIGGQEVTRVYEGEMEFRAHRPAGAGISPQRRCHPVHPGRAAEQRSEGAHRLYRARRSRRGEAGDRRRLHLPREQPALRAAEIQRARPRSRLDRGRGAGARRREGAAAAGLQDGMDRRVRRAGGGARSGSRSSCRSACC